MHTQVRVSNIHIRMQESLHLDALAGGVMLQQLIVDEHVDPDSEPGFTIPMSYKVSIL